MRPSPWFVGLALTLYAAPAVAQRLTEPWVPGAAALRISAPSIRSSLRRDSTVTASPAGRAFAAVLGGGVGFVAGGIIGYHLDIRNGYDDLGLEGAAWGAVLGESLGMVAGATLASPSQSKALDWLAVPAIALAGVGLASVTHRAEVMLIVPAAQIYELMSGRPSPDARPEL